MNLDSSTDNKYFKKGISMIIIMIIIYLAIPFLLLVLAIFHSFNNDVDFASSLKGIVESTGPLGDTLGGTLGPIVAIIAALLTYWAFMEQVKANNLQFAEINRIKYDERFTLFLTIYRENVEKVESNGVSFQVIFNEFKFIYLVLYEKVKLDIDKRNILNEVLNKEMDLEINFDDIVNISFAILIFGLDSVYEDETLKINTNSANETAYLEGMKRLNQIRTGSASGASVSYESRFDNSTKYHYIQTSNESFNGHGRSLENYFNNIDSFLSFIELHIVEIGEYRQSTNNLNSSISILESQLTLFELFLLYFYGMSILSNTFGDLFLDSGLIFRVPVNKIDFHFDLLYKGEWVDNDTGLSKYSDLFKS